MGEYVEYYCKNNNHQLKKIVNTIIVKNFKWLPQKEYDDFYSLAGQVVWSCENNFDDTKGTAFKTYLISCLYRRIKSRITYMNREKRSKDIENLSINSFIDSEGNITLEDVLSAKEQVELTPIAQRYIDSLSKTQRRVAEMIMEGYEIKTIKEILHLSDKRFSTIFNRMKSEEKMYMLEKMRGI